MKRKIAMILLVVMLVTMFAACSGESGKHYVLAGIKIGTWTSTVDEFREIHPEVTEDYFSLIVYDDGTAKMTEGKKTTDMHYDSEWIWENSNSKMAFTMDDSGATIAIGDGTTLIFKRK